MLQQYERVAPVHCEVSPALQEWYAMLAAARASSEADRYANAVACILETMATTPQFDNSSLPTNFQTPH
jgi:hypothetical protein